MKNSQQQLADTKQQVKNSQKKLADTKQEAALMEQKTITIKKILAQAKQERQQLNGETVSKKCWENWKNKSSQIYVSFPTKNLRDEGKKHYQVKSDLVLSEEYIKLLRDEPHTFELSSIYEVNFALGGTISDVSLDETPVWYCNNYQADD